MRCGWNIGFARNAGDGVVCPLTRCPAGPISDRYKARGKRRERDNRIPKLLFHLFGFGWEEFKADFAVTGKTGEKGRGQRPAGFLHLGKRENHATILKLFFGRGVANDSFCPIHTFTMSSPDSSAT